MLPENKGVPFLHVLFFFVVEIDEILQGLAVLKQEPGVVYRVLRDWGAGFEGNFTVWVKEWLLRLGNKDDWSGGFFGGRFLLKLATCSVRGVLNAKNKNIKNKK